MPGVQPFTFELEDFKDPARFQAFQDAWTRLQTEVNRLAGVFGPTEHPTGLNLQGTGAITNIGSTPDSNSALTQATATPVFGPAAQNAALEATGTNPLQTVRRLNDQQQREQHSTFLNDVLNLPPVSNTSTITVVAAGANSNITVSAGTFKWGDGSVASYAQRMDTVVNPGAGSNYYYYYLRKSDNTVQFIGPFTTDNSSNQLGASTDGRGFLGKAVVNAGGGGTGGGGGDPPAQGGCLELGTPISVPTGKKWSMEIQGCDNWIVVELIDGRRLVAARDTQFAVFKKVQDLDWRRDELIDESGKTVSISSLTDDHHQGKKMKMTVEGRLYLGNGILLSNWKPNS